LVFYLSFWWLNTILYCVIFYVLKAYEAPLRIILIYIGCGAGMAYFFFTLGEYGVLNFSEMYIAFLVFVKVLEAFRCLICDLSVLSAFARYPMDAMKDLSGLTDEEQKKKKKDKEQSTEKREKYVAFMLHVVNKLFLVTFGRVILALVWGFTSWIIGLLLRPYIANLFLFGENLNSRNFSFLRPIRKMRTRQSRFGVNV